MKVIILAGGFGTRISEYSDTIPKPMIPVGGKPILQHIMEIYAKYGYKDFIIALGYKGEIIKNFFNNNNFNWNINMVDTGEKTMTGGRLKKLANYIGKETFMLTYGDGVADIDIKELVKYHKSHGKIGTVTSVRPPVRFGSLKIDGNKVSLFREKSQLDSGWISGGFFVFESKIFQFIKDDQTLLEKEPLEKLTEMQELYAFKHEKFWQCMDTKRDLVYLETLIKQKKKKW